MSRTDKKDIQKVPGTMAGASALSRFAESDNSMSLIKQYRVVPRLKYIQGLSDPNLKKQFGEGAVIVRPGDALVAKDADHPFLFVPQFFFSEFCKWSDRRDKEQPSIVERSYDPTSNLAKLCGDKNKRDLIYSGHESRTAKEQWHYKHVQHFCFPGLIYGDHPLAGESVVLSFERGEWITGRQFIGAVGMRRHEGHRVPLWAQVWKMTPALRKNDQGSWYALDYSAPEQPVILESEMDSYFASHQELAHLHEENRLRVDFTDDKEGSEPEQSSGDGVVDPADSM